MLDLRRLLPLGLISLALVLSSAAEKPKPDARFGNWLYKKPEGATWKPLEKNGLMVFAVDMPPGDFCTLTLFAGNTARPGFAEQFNTTVEADLKAKDLVRIEADSGAKPSKSQEGFDMLTRSLRCETSQFHTFHIYIAGRNGGRFDMAAFQTSSEETWKSYGTQASEFLQSLKLANSLSPTEVEELAGSAAPAAPTLPGFGDEAPVATTEKTKEIAPAQALAPSKVPEVPLEKSPLVINSAVIQKDGKPIDGIKLSQHDMEIGSPSIVVGQDGTIHCAFVEKHRTTYALAVYHRSSSDSGKTWSEAKNLSEELPGILAGRCIALIDGKNRLYVVWRSGLKENFPAAVDAWGGSHANAVYRVLEGGKWSKIKPVHPPGSPDKQNDGSISFFAAADAAGNAQVIWNTRPDKWHPELTVISGSYTQSLAGIGNGLVFQATLDGATASTPREIFLPKVGGKEQGGYGLYCDGLETVNGYVDSTGGAHFVANISKTHEPISGKSRYQVIENGQAGWILDLPELSFHAWRDVPTLLVDSAGRQHVIALYRAGEHPNVRDYLVGSDDEPTVIRAATGTMGSIDGFQAYQGPGGRMITIVQVNDTGERGSGDTYVSVSKGNGWSKPINITNNAGRRSFASKRTSSASNIAVAKSYYPGRAAAAFDREGRLLLLMINNEFGLFSSSAFGVTLAGGNSSTPTLQFLRL